METTKEIQQREEFKKILWDLGKSQTILSEPGARSNIYQRLEALYYRESKREYFRHFYSDIFSVLTQIHQESQMNIEVLGQNLLVIRKGYHPLKKDSKGNDIDISENIKKLYDHVSLDIARLNYSDKADRELLKEDSIAQVKSQLNVISNNTKEIEKQYIDIEAQLKNSQKEYISILGIFAAIVLAFTGGIVFSTSVLQNLHLSSPYLGCFSILTD